MNQVTFYGVMGATALFSIAMAWSAPYILFGFLAWLFFLPKTARIVTMLYSGLLLDLLSSHLFGAGIFLVVLLLLSARVLDSYRLLNSYLFGLGVAIVSFGALLYFTLFRFPTLFVFGGIDAILDALLWQLSDMRSLFVIVLSSICAAFFARYQAKRYHSAFFSL